MKKAPVPERFIFLRDKSLGFCGATQIGGFPPTLRRTVMRPLPNAEIASALTRFLSGRPRQAIRQGSVCRLHTIGDSLKGENLAYFSDSQV